MGRSACCLPALLCALPWPCHHCSLAVLTAWCLSRPCCSDGKRDSGSASPGAPVARQKLLHQATFSDRRAAGLVWGAEPPGAAHGQPPGSPGSQHQQSQKLEWPLWLGHPQCCRIPSCLCSPRTAQNPLGSLLIEKGQQLLMESESPPVLPSGSAQGTAVSGTSSSDGLATAQELFVTFMPILACMAVLLALGDRAALHGTTLLHRAGGNYPSPCACPLLSPWQLHSRALSQGCWRGCQH